MNKVGIIGMGVVGNALYQSLKDKDVTVYGYDKYKEEYADVAPILQCDAVFLCLPTPYSEKHQKYDISAIIDVCSELYSQDYQGLVVLKSTVEPETTAYLADIFELDMIHNPEFITARTAREDMDNQSHIVIGTTENCHQEKLESLIIFFKAHYPHASLSICSSNESEMMKIAVNSFYATKVQFFNEIYLLCQKIDGTNYDVVKELMLKNNWINPKHTLVPGPDGKLSFGGMCLPKDTNALYEYMKRKASPFMVVGSAVLERKFMRDD